MTVPRISSNGVLSDAKGEKQLQLQDRRVYTLSAKVVDTGAQVVAGLSTELDPAEAARVRCVIPGSSNFLIRREHAGKRLIITSSQ